jgi:hypothetical protein
VFKILYDCFGSQGKIVVQNADRCFTVMVGEWDTVTANNRTVTRIIDPGGTYSDMDENAIHLQDGYWEQTTEAVSKCLMLKSRVEGRLSSYGYRTLLDFLSRTNYGQSQKEVLDSLIFTME